MRRHLRYLRDKLFSSLKQLPYLWRGLWLVWDAAPVWTLFWLVLLVIQGLLPVAVVNLTKYLVDGLVSVIESQGSWETLRFVFVLIVLMGIVLVVREILRSASSLIRTVQSERVRDSISGLIHEKSAEIDLGYYDSPDYYDQLHRARLGAASRPMALLESTGILIQNGITLVAMLFVLIPYSIWLPVALLISTLPAFFVVLNHRLRFHQWYVNNTHDERLTWYYDYLLTARETAGEVRLFNLSDHFRTSYQEIRERLRGERTQLAKDQGKAEMIAGFAALLVTGMSMAWMVWRAILGEVTLGDLALFYSAFNQGQSLMRSFLENAGEIYSNSFFLGDLFDFLTLEPAVQDPETPVAIPQYLQQGICFHDVTFHYPGSANPVLKGFNLCVRPGQVVAIVGPNGAGKSTLIKLLCRFYDPQEGIISIDNIDLRNFAIQDLRAHLTVLFQEPVNYSATVKENIALGDLNASAEMEKVVSAAEASGADEPIGRLPEGYETFLGKWFQGGADLSVGEWQRLALARAFLRQAPIIVLDEPTSAMDPWAEADWLQRFRTLAVGHTAILITHRFTTAAFADLIYVIENGKIVESGQHGELIVEGGRYAQSWKAQMQRWQEASQPASQENI
jgi:ATP-binding cassette subfamily B protein